MNNLRAALKEQRPELLVYGCQAHLLNLLAKDLAKEQQPTLDRVQEGLKFFCNNHAAHAELVFSY